MKIKNAIYWSSTVLFSVFMGLAGLACLGHFPKVDAAFRLLGYPAYFQNFLGLAKLLGAIALLVPRFPLLKEWAYAGFTFTFIGAFVSHLAASQGHEAIVPVIAFALLCGSYLFRPAPRRLEGAWHVSEMHSGARRHAHA